MVDLIYNNRFRIKNQKVSGWRYDELNSKTIYFHKSTELNESNYVKIPSRGSTVLNNETDDNYCFFWLILARLRYVKIFVLTEYQFRDKILMD